MQVDQRLGRPWPANAPQIAHCHLHHAPRKSVRSLAYLFQEIEARQQQQSGDKLLHVNSEVDVETQIDERGCTPRSAPDALSTLHSSPSNDGCMYVCRGRLSGRSNSTTLYPLLSACSLWQHTWNFGPPIQGPRESLNRSAQIVPIGLVTIFPFGNLNAL